jgi:hypothetical protein
LTTTLIATFSDESYPHPTAHSAGRMRASNTNQENMPNKTGTHCGLQCSSQRLRVSNMNKLVKGNINMYADVINLQMEMVMVPPLHSPPI